MHHPSLCPQGELQPDMGDIVISGRRISAGITALSSAEKRPIGFCPQFNPLYTGLTVRNHFHIFAGLNGIKGVCRIRAITNEVNWHDDDDDDDDDDGGFFTLSTAAAAMIFVFAVVAFVDALVVYGRARISVEKAWFSSMICKSNANTAIANVYSGRSF